MPRPNTVLLDVDGTLIDSNDAHARAWVQALAHFGYSVAFERVRDLIGMGGDKLLVRATGIEKDSSLGKQIDELRGQTFMREHLPQLKPFPGARELLSRMREDGITLVVATSAKEAEMDALLELSGIQDLVQLRTSSDDAEKSKPDPDIIRAALEKAGAEPQSTLMLGDTPYDVEAATRSGVRTVAVRSGGWGDKELEGALAIYDNVAELHARYAQSPFGAR